MEISDNGIKLLKEYEAFSAEPYNDDAGNATIGYGDLMHSGPVTEEEESIRITIQEAEERLQKKIKSFSRAINNSVKVLLNQNQFDALVLWVYNCGVGAMLESSWLKELNVGGYTLVPTLMKRWDRVYKGDQLVICKGLVARRDKEAQLFVKVV